MRMMQIVRIPHETFNEAVRDGSVGAKNKAILEEIKPEAVYFTETNGHRGAVLIVDVKKPSEIPSLAEPWFLTFNADVEFKIVMSPEDLAKSGLDELAKKCG